MFVLLLKCGTAFSICWQCWCYCTIVWLVVLFPCFPFCLVFTDHDCQIRACRGFSQQVWELLGSSLALDSFQSFFMYCEWRKYVCLICVWLEHVVKKCSIFSPHFCLSSEVCQCLHEVVLTESVHGQIDKKNEASFSIK